MSQVIDLSESGGLYPEMENSGINFFNRDRTLALIELYKKYKPRLGTFQIKSNRVLWEVVAKELSETTNLSVSASKCENRWKVLERNYKKVVDNNRQTGRGLRIFEFENEFDEIYGRKRNLRPVILLSSTSVVPLHESSDLPISNLQEQEIATATISCEESPNVLPCTSTEIHIEDRASSLGITPRKRSVRKSTSTYKRRNDILTDMKNDLREYYKEKIKRDEEKLELEKKKLQDRTRRTDLLERYISMQEDLMRNHME